MRAANNAPRIAFVGPIAEPGQPAGGGFAAANRRTIDLLRAQGLKVLEFPYPAAEGSILRKSATYGLRFTEIAAGLIRSRRGWDILHITPMLRQFLVAELIICQVPRKLNRTLFLDLRAGGIIYTYNKRGPRYRRALGGLISKANFLAIEGQVYADFVRQWRSDDPFYFPNYVVWKNEFENIQRQAPSEAETIRLVTVGRIVPGKGVELAIELTELLNTSGYRADLEIIGNGDPNYVSILKARSLSLPVNFTGALALDKIVHSLAKRHFFVFATTHLGEGHSNALTEAMAVGVVPICSDNGFNSNVVGGAGVVLPRDASAQDYADAIKHHCGSEATWRAASQHALKRTRSNFSDKVVLPKLIDAYFCALGNQGMQKCI